MAKSKPAEAKSVAYRSVAITVNSVEAKKEFENKQSPAGKKFLVFGLSMQNNNRQYPVILFFDEEVRLLVGEETIGPATYKIENNLDPGQTAEGYLIFEVPEKPDKFVLQFGKKIGPKTELSIKI